MIEEGLLSKDGKKPLKSLDSIAGFLVDNGQFPTVASLVDLGLKKRNGEQYKKRAYQKALNYANGSLQRKKYT
jgi:hypothetical protein